MAATLVETLGIEVSGVPMDITGVGHTGDRFNLRHYNRIVFILTQGTWQGGGPAVTLQQHTAATGGASKALAFDHRWAKLALVATSVWTKLAVTNNTFPITDVGNTFHAIEINAAQLDQENGYTYISLNVSSPGANTNFLALIALLPDVRFGGDPNTGLPDPKV